MRVVQSWVPGGDAGARSTVQRMIGLVRRASAHPSVRGTAVQIVRTYDGRDYVSHAKAIREWAALHVQFLRDPRGTELLHDPVLLVETVKRVGVVHVDCDDAAMLAAALGRSIGLRARFVVLAFLDKRAPFAHVFAELSPPVGSPRWIEQDVTRATEQIPFNAISRSFIVEV